MALADSNRLPDPGESPAARAVRRGDLMWAQFGPVLTDICNRAVDARIEDQQVPLVTVYDENGNRRPPRHSAFPSAALQKAERNRTLGCLRGGHGFMPRGLLPVPYRASGRA